MTTTYTQGTRVDHYEIIRMLGHGGMNWVYLARDVNNEQEVVLKFPNADLIGNIAVFERYKREAEIGNRVHHPQVQQLLNTDEKRSEDYLVVEYIQGKTLRDVLEEHAPSPLPVAEAIRIAILLCEALEYCHERGIFHRDIKPENIMVQEDGNIKIIDFGIALLEGARRVTWRGLSGTVGTPDYMSPEQLKGERGTASSDIYAAGVILYEMLCGHTPFEGENIFAIMNQHVSQDPPSVLLMNPQLSPELATVVMHAIRRDQSKRYTSMKDLLHDLRHLEEVKPVTYEPDTPSLNQSGRTAIMAILIIIAICLVIIALGFLVQFAHHVGH
ncbi:MAG TPA: serine/threonine-protein kinase [Ktedonobacteraceae bacterium]|nr:serine/threonine-protein kinase [Ktedonobacteraceae bacterium]